jgi:hypothetical protein
MLEFEIAGLFEWLVHSLRLPYTMEVGGFSGFLALSNSRKQKVCDSQQPWFRADTLQYLHSRNEGLATICSVLSSDLKLPATDDFVYQFGVATIKQFSVVKYSSVCCTRCGACASGVAIEQLAIDIAPAM